MQVGKQREKRGAISSGAGRRKAFVRERIAGGFARRLLRRVGAGAGHPALHRLPGHCEAPGDGALGPAAADRGHDRLALLEREFFMATNFTSDPRGISPAHESLITDYFSPRFPSADTTPSAITPSSAEGGCGRFGRALRSAPSVCAAALTVVSPAFATPWI